MAKTIQVPVGEPIGENDSIDKSKIIQGTPAPVPKGDVEGQSAKTVKVFCNKCESYNVLLLDDCVYISYRCWNCSSVSFAPL